jgi:hypothetical protein
LEWRADLYAIQFPVAEGRHCFIHRLALRKFLGRTPTACESLEFAARNSEILKAAAEDRCVHLQAAGRWGNFHLTSRDIARKF